MEINLEIIKLYQEIMINSRKRKERLVTIIQKMQRDSRRRKILIIKYLKNTIINKKCWVQRELMPPVAPSFFESVVPHYSDQRFLQKFRLSRKTFDYICRELDPYMKRRCTVMRDAIPVAKRVAIAIYVLKSNADLWTVADLFKVGKSTVGHILLEFCNAIVSHFYDRTVKFPSNEEERSNIALNFWQRWQFPGTFGAMDGTHIPILAPPEYPEDYYNYKGFHSIQLLAVVDHRYRFIYANIGRPGRMNDASVFRGRGLYKEFSSQNENPPIQTTQFHIISDAAFPLLTWIMKPYPISNNMSLQHRNYNYRLSRARMVIEDTFGRLKGRWRILLKRADFKLENMKKIVEACIILHNLCENNNDYFHTVWLEEAQLLEALYIRTNRVRAANHAATREAVLKRNAVADHLMSDGHSIQFQ